MIPCDVNDGGTRNTPFSIKDLLCEVVSSRNCQLSGTKDVLLDLPDHLKEDIVNACMDHQKLEMFAKVMEFDKDKTQEHLRALTKKKWRHHTDAGEDADTGFIEEEEGEQDNNNNNATANTEPIHYVFSVSTLDPSWAFMEFATGPDEKKIFFAGSDGIGIMYNEHRTDGIMMLDINEEQDYFITDLYSFPIIAMNTCDEYVAVLTKDFMLGVLQRDDVDKTLNLLWSDRIFQFSPNHKTTPMISMRKKARDDDCDYNYGSMESLPLNIVVIVNDIHGKSNVWSPVISHACSRNPVMDRGNINNVVTYSDYNSKRNWLFRCVNQGTENFVVCGYDMKSETVALCETTFPVENDITCVCIVPSNNDDDDDTLPRCRMLIGFKEDGIIRSIDARVERDKLKNLKRQLILTEGPTFDTGLSSIKDIQEGGDMVAALAHSGIINVFDPCTMEHVTTIDTDENIWEMTATTQKTKKKKPKKTAKDNVREKLRKGIAFPDHVMRIDADRLVYFDCTRSLLKSWTFGPMTYRK